jgi:hypothetical protein
MVEEFGETEASLIYAKNNYAMPETIQEAQVLMRKVSTDFFRERFEQVPMSEILKSKEALRDFLVEYELIEAEPHISHPNRYMITPAGKAEILDILKGLQERYGYPFSVIDDTFVELDAERITEVNGKHEMVKAIPDLTDDEIIHAVVEGWGLSPLQKEKLLTKFSTEDLRNLMIERMNQNALLPAGAPYDFRSYRVMVDLFLSMDPTLKKLFPKVHGTPTYQYELSLKKYIVEKRALNSEIDYDLLTRDSLAQILSMVGHRSEQATAAEMDVFTDFFMDAHKRLALIDNMHLYDATNRAVMKESRQQENALPQKPQSRKLYYATAPGRKKGKTLAEEFEAQKPNDTQREIIAKLVEMGTRNPFDEDAHQHFFVPPGGGTPIPVPSTTGKLGSDFDSSLMRTDIIESFAKAQAEGVFTTDVNNMDAEQGLLYLVEQCAKDQGAFSLEDLRIFLDPYGDDYKVLFNVIADNVGMQIKTLFGTAVHALIEDFINGKPVDLEQFRDNPMVNIEMLHAALYGTDVNNPGVFDVLKKLRSEGYVFMPEVKLSNVNMGGIIDVVAISPAGVVRILDFKTKNIREKYKSKNKSLTEEFLEVIELNSSKEVTGDPAIVLQNVLGFKRNLVKKWSQQLSLYKKILMEAGVTVEDLVIIGLPYMVEDETGAMVDMKMVQVEVPFEKNIGNNLFQSIDPSFDANHVVKNKPAEDALEKSLRALGESKVYEMLIRSFAVIDHMYSYYGFSKDTKEIYDALKRGVTDQNDFKNLRNYVKRAIEDEQGIQSYTHTVRDFMHMIVESAEIVNIVVDQFNKAKAEIADTPLAMKAKLNKLHKLNEFLKGYNRMFEEISSIESITDSDNPVHKQIATIQGVIKNVQDSYIQDVTPIVAGILAGQNGGELLLNMKRQYDERIKSAQDRGLYEEAAKLKKERDELGELATIQQTLQGKRGDSSYFYSQWVSTLSNPDVVIASFAKNMQSAMNKVRIQNLGLRDDLGKRFMQRRTLMGSSWNKQKFNEGLTKRVKKYNSRIDKETEELWLLTEYSEELYYDYEKLKRKVIDARKDIRENGKDAARELALEQATAAVLNFEKEYFQSEFTDHYYELTGMLDTMVTYEGTTQSIRKIQDDLRTQARVLRKAIGNEDFREGNMNHTEFKAYRDIQEKLKNLGSRFDVNGREKTGDALKIYEVLKEYREKTKDIYNREVYEGLFQRRENDVIAKYGEGSAEHDRFLEEETVVTLSDEYYQRISEIYARMDEIAGNTAGYTVSPIREQINELKRAYRDDENVVNGSWMQDREDILQKIKDLEEQEKVFFESTDRVFFNTRNLTTEEATDLNALYAKGVSNMDADEYDRYEYLKGLSAERADNEELAEYQALRKELRKLREKRKTSHYHKAYYSELEAFSIAKGCTMNEAETKFVAEWYQTPWFQRNHIFEEKKVMIKGAKKGDPQFKMEMVPRPISVWTEIVPATDELKKKYMTRKPNGTYNRSELKESYVDAAGVTHKLKNTDNRDILNRFKPRPAAEYQAKYGRAHKYLDPEYARLKQGYLSNALSAQDKQNYEDLLYLTKLMTDQQEGLEMTNRLGYAVPYIRRDFGDRLAQDGAGKIVSSVGNTIRDKFTKTENDINAGTVATPKTPDELQREADDALNNELDIDGIGTLANDEYKAIPVQFTTKGDLSQASYDVWGGILHYAASINKKKGLEGELALANGLQDILEAHPVKGEKGNRKINEVLEKYTPDAAKDSLEKIKLHVAGATQRQQAILNYTRAMFYNEETNAGTDILGVNTGKTVSTMMRAIAFRTLAGAPTTWMANAISGNIQSIIESVSGKYYNFNEYLGAKNTLYNPMGASEYGSPIRDLMADVNALYTKDGPTLGNKSFWGQLLDVFDALQGQTQDEFGNPTDWSKRKNILGHVMYGGKNFTEWEMQVTSFIAYMKNQKVINGELMNRETYIRQNVPLIPGESMNELIARKMEAAKKFNEEKVTLLDILEKDATGKLNVKPAYATVFQIGDEKFDEMVNQINALQKKINGSFHEKDKSQMERTAFGTMMTFFRKYVIPFAVNRYATRHNDWEAMRVEEGFYMTTFRLLKEDLVAANYNLVKNWNRYSQEERQAIKQTLLEVGIVLAMLGAATLLFGYDDDDEDRFKKLEEKPYLAQAALYVLLKAKSETEGFIPWPSMGLNEMWRIVSTPTLVINDVKQYIYLTDLTLRSGFYYLGGNSDNLGHFFGVEEKGVFYQSDVSDSGLKDKDDLKWFAEAAGMMGYTGKTLHPIDAIKGYEYAQRIK